MVGSAEGGGRVAVSVTTDAGVGEQEEISKTKNEKRKKRNESLAVRMGPILPLSIHAQRCWDIFPVSIRVRAAMGNAAGIETPRCAYEACHHRLDKSA